MTAQQSSQRTCISSPQKVRQKSVGCNRIWSARITELQISSTRPSAQISCPPTTFQPEITILSTPIRLKEDLILNVMSKFLWNVSKCNLVSGNLLVNTSELFFFSNYPSWREKLRTCQIVLSFSYRKTFSRLADEPFGWGARWNVPDRTEDYNVTRERCFEHS